MSLFVSTLLFSSIRDTHTPNSESKYDEIKEKRPSQKSGLNSRLRDSQTCLDHKML